MLSPQEMKLFKQRIQQDKTLNREYQMTIALRDASNQQVQADYMKQIHRREKYISRVKLVSILVLVCASFFLAKEVLLEKTDIVPGPFYLPYGLCHTAYAPDNTAR